MSDERRGPDVLYYVRGRDSWHVTDHEQVAGLGMGEGSTVTRYVPEAELASLRSALADSTAKRAGDAAAIRAVLGDGAWPPGVHHADALRSYVGRLRAERDALIAAWPEERDEPAGPILYCDDRWWLLDGDLDDWTGTGGHGPFPTREAAVMAAIGAGAKAEKAEGGEQR